MSEPPQGDTPAGILSAAYQMPAATRAASQVLSDEGIEPEEALLNRLGVEQVGTCDGETGSELALAAAQEALRRAQLSPERLGAILDYTVLPQEYLVPSWSMSNKLQSELGAKRAFTIGFSGGGATQFLLALETARGLLADEALEAVLLVGAEVSIPGNRVLPRSEPFALLGDGASAMVVGRSDAGWKILGTELWSDGPRHDVCYIPGGALRYPDRLDLYELQLDRSAVRSAPRLETLGRLTDALLARWDLPIDRMAGLLTASPCAEDEEIHRQAFAAASGPLAGAARRRHGFLYGSDFVIDWLHAVETDAFDVGDYLLLHSHGMGFLYGAGLVRR